MCTSPITIKNPRIKANTFILGVDKEYLSVPCGCCDECQHAKMKDMLFRGYHEYLSCIAKGGFFLFNTLTFSDKNVPRSNGCMFFRKRDIQLFLKRVRKELTKRGYEHEGKLKYIACSEFGEITFRPHWHIGFAVSFKIDPYVFDKICSDCWKRCDVVIDKMGFTDAKDVESRIVNSIFGIRYIVKYICKGSQALRALLNGYPTSHFCDFVRQECFKHGLDINTLPPAELRKIWKFYKELHPQVKDLSFMPVTLMSKGFGMSFLENIDYDSLLDVIPIEQKSPKGYIDYNIPQYYIRKVFYDYDKNSKRFILNEYGKEYLHKKFGDFVKSYDDYFNTHSVLLDKITEEKTGFLTFTSLVSHYLDCRSLNHFVKYVVYFRNRTIHPAMLFLYDDYTDTNINMAVDTLENIILESYVNDDNGFVYREDIGNINKFDSATKLNFCTLYNSLKCFEGYDQLFSLLESIKLEYCKKRDELYKIKDVEDIQKDIITNSAFSHERGVIY